MVLSSPVLRVRRDNFGKNKAASGMAHAGGGSGLTRQF